jgi:hypothetical protein
MLAVALPLGAYAHTGTSPDMVVATRSMGEKSIFIHLGNLDKIPTFVELYKENGELLYRRTITDYNGFSLELDLKSVTGGRYVLVIERAGVTYRQPVLLDLAGIRLSQMTEEKSSLHAAN